MSFKFDFSGKHVFVAGGSSGINLGIADAFSRSGTRVSVCSRAPNKMVTSQLLAHGSSAAGYRADLRLYEEVEAAMSQAHGQFGLIDVLISGAAGNLVARLWACRPTASRRSSTSTCKALSM